MKYQRTLCTGTASAARMANTQSAVELRAAVEKVTAAGYRFGSWLPAAAVEPNRRLGNGAFLLRTRLNGDGVLDIVHKGTFDAVVVLALKGTQNAVLAVYARAGEKVHVAGFADGDYESYLLTGQDWDDAAKTFSRTCSYLNFGDIAFHPPKGKYTVWTFTLDSTWTGQTLGGDGRSVIPKF